MSPASAIAASGLVAATLKLGASAANLVNANDVARVGGKPAFNPLGVQNSSLREGGVAASVVTLSPGQTLAFDPTSVLANAQGLVQAPEIDPASEVSNQLLARQAFAFSLEALKVAGENEKTLLNIKV
jgi:flagellar basal-body rod protein FlgC